jgi:hypothetical protein
MTSYRVGLASVAKIRAYVKQLGCAAAKRIRLYGEKFRVVSDPMSSVQWGCSSDDEERSTHSPIAHSGGRVSACEKGSR